MEKINVKLVIAQDGSGHLNYNKTISYIFGRNVKRVIEQYQNDKSLNFTVVNYKDVVR